MEKEKLINMIYMAREMPEMTFIFNDTNSYSKHSSSLFLYSLEKQDLVLLEWLMQATHIKKDFLFDDNQKEIVLSAIHSGKEQWLNLYLSCFNQYAGEGEIVVQNMYEFFVHHFDDMSESFQDVITKHMFERFKREKHLRQPVHEWMEKLIEKEENAKFQILYEQLVTQVSHNKIEDLNAHAFLNSITYGNRFIFDFLFPKMGEFLKDEYSEETLTIRIGLSQHVEVLNWLEEVGLSLNNPLTQEDLIFSTLNGGGCNLLEKLYERGARFYHADQKNQRWEHKLTLFEDLQDREGKELSALTHYMYQYESENLPLLIENLQASVYPEGVQIVNAIILHEKMHAQLEEKPIKKQPKI